MPHHHHEVPTHLNVEDKVVFGLTVRQFLYLLVGSSAGYALWNSTAQAGPNLRLMVVSVCLLVAGAFALLRPGGRSLEEWSVAALIYLACPRHTTWQPAEPDSLDWRPAADNWQALAPDVAWLNDARPVEA